MATQHSERGSTNWPISNTVLSDVGNTDKRQTVIFCKYSSKILNICNNPLQLNVILLQGDGVVYRWLDRCILYRHSSEYLDILRVFIIVFIATDGPRGLTNMDAAIALLNCGCYTVDVREYATQQLGDLD